MPDAPRPKPVIAPQDQQTAKPNPASALIALAAIVGVGTATALVDDTRKDEGVVYKAYPDVGTIFTICSGSTHGVKAGDVATREQCDAMTAADLRLAANTVLGCAPNLKGHANQLRAAIRFQNNTGKFCSSSGGKLMAQGHLKAGCDALLAYNGIISKKPIRGAVQVRRLKDGRYFSVIRGLKNRRDHEHQICVAAL